MTHHRRHYVRRKHIDYDSFHPSRIYFIPPAEWQEFFRQDYEIMQGSMIYTNSPSFQDLLQQLKLFNGQLRLMGKGLLLEDVIAAALQQNPDFSPDQSVVIVKLPVQMITTSNETVRYIVTMHRYKELVFEKMELVIE